MIYLYFRIEKKKSEKLPVYYPESVQTVNAIGVEKKDSVYHTIPDFKFINQNGDTITEEYFKNKIFVADFFFSTCPTICPKMMTQMERVNDAEKARMDFLIISHSVNPERDSVSALNEYAKKVHADGKKWMLVTGKKKDIYDIAMDGYKLPLSEDPREPEGFLHSSLFVLVDKEKRVRGYYDGTDSSKVNLLIHDIVVLSSEYSDTLAKP